MTEPLRYHPLANLFPLLDGEAFDALVADIEENGLQDPVVLHEDGSILDGRNRYRACQAAGVDARMEMFHGPDPLAFVISKNLKRRHLNESQRAMVAARLANMRQGERTDLEPSAKSRKVDQASAATRLNVSPRLVQSAKAVQEKATPEIKDAVDRGHLAVSAAAKAAALAPEVQQKIAAEAATGRANVVRTVIKRETRTLRERELGAKQTALPDKRYGVILADPEWKWQPWGAETGQDRAAENHYPTRSTDEIAARNAGAIAADDCVLFLWATASMLKDALAVMAAWGFDYKTHLVWGKERTGNARGTGYWLSDEHELLLIGTRGHVPAPTGDVQARSLQCAPVGRHSAKPELFHEIIERYFPSLPKIELNRRGPARPGWDAWGNEVSPSGCEAVGQTEKPSSSAERGSAEEESS